MNFDSPSQQEVVAEGLDAHSERVELARELVHEVLEHHTELGRGNDGIVRMFKEPLKQDYCVKELININAATTVNDLEAEMHLQESAIKLGARSPEPILCFTSEAEACLVMETIKGKSIEDVIKRGAVLPPSFDEPRFWTKARAILDSIHTGNIYHRDVHAGNIMVEDTTGDPVLIDYGRACRAMGDEDPYVQVDVLGRQINFNDDYEGLRQTQIKLRQHLTELSA